MSDDGAGPSHVVRHRIALGVGAFGFFLACILAAQPTLLPDGLSPAGMRTLGVAFVILPPLVMMVGVSIVVMGVTELASNTATAALVLPVLASVAKATGTEPLDLMTPATVMASMGFAMPVGTAPNALVVGTGRVRAGDMMRIGWKVDLLAIVVVVALMAVLR